MTKPFLTLLLKSKSRKCAKLFLGLGRYIDTEYAIHLFFTYSPDLIESTSELGLSLLLASITNKNKNAKVKYAASFPILSRFKFKTKYQSSFHINWNFVSHFIFYVNVKIGK